MSSAPAVRRPAWPLLVAGGAVGVTWAAALRGWMVQMAGDSSAFHWYGTFALVLTPGLVVGALLGLAEHRRRTGGSRSRWLVSSPCLFLVAVTDPTIFRQLVTEGTGGGAIGVVMFGLAGGYALSGRGRAWRRRACGVLAVLGVVLMTVLASGAVPLETAHGLWVGLYAASLLAVLMLACAIPHRIGETTFVHAGWVPSAVGAVCGFAWAAALRAFLWEVAGAHATVTWAGTFVGVLLPGTIIGALAGWADHRRRTGALPHARWLVCSPMLFATVLLQNPLDLRAGLPGGSGLAAVAVPVTCMLGGYAIGGSGPLWLRVGCGLVPLSALPVWSLTATDVGGASMSLRDPHGLWSAVLCWGLLATFCVAAAIPRRRAAPPSGDLWGRLRTWSRPGAAQVAPDRQRSQGGRPAAQRVRLPGDPPRVPPVLSGRRPRRTRR